MIFGPLAIIRWDHNSSEPKENQAFEVELKINQDNKLVERKLNRKANEPVENLLYRLKLLMPGGLAGINQGPKSALSKRELHLQRQEQAKTPTTDQEYPRIISEKDTTAILSKSAPLFEIFPPTEVENRRIQIDENEQIRLILNPPTIVGQQNKEIVLCPKPKVGVRIFPKMTIHHGDYEDFTMKWFKIIQPTKVASSKKNKMNTKHKWHKDNVPATGNNGDATNSPISKKLKLEPKNSDEMDTSASSVTSVNVTVAVKPAAVDPNYPIQVGTGNSYLPVDSDIGYTISVCVELKRPFRIRMENGGNLEYSPKKVGFTGAPVTPHPILRSDINVPFRNRHKMTENKYG